MDKKYLINDREPQELYHFFEDLAAIPRISCNEATAAAYVVNIAKKYGLWYYEDDIHNVLVRKTGSSGCEDLPPVLLEGHLDIVGEKTADSSHNFVTDPIKLIREGNILYADRTTLGADNGCAVAVMLKLLTDNTLVHPPLECLFTVQEEIGLCGVKHFDASLLKSKRVIGLDAGSDGVFRMGTSNKIERLSLLPVTRESIHGTVYRLTIDGLCGGDQGAGIPKERICAIKMTARVLHYLNKEMDVRVISMKHIGKSIPESCTTYISLVEGSEKRLYEILALQQELIRQEYEDSDPGINIYVVRDSSAAKMLTKADSNRLIQAIYLLPYGARNRRLCRVDEVSCSVIMKKIYTDIAGIHIFSVISAEDMCNGESLSEEMETFFDLFGFKTESLNLNKGWAWTAVSPIRETMIAAFVELFGRQPKVNISHGSNDCVILKEKLPDLDIVTTAADYVDYHTPKERLDMDSFEREYALIERTLAKLV